MPSQLKILGCSGGIGGSLRTTALLIDDDILIDAGTGVCDLSLEEMARIDWVFLTHSHLDHVLSLPLLLDSVGARREKPVQVFGLPETIDALRQHILNNVIWPDFSKIPSIEYPFVVFNTLHVGETHTVGARNIQVLPARHSVPAVGYALTVKESTIAFTGDSGPCPEFWEAISTMLNLKHVLIETSFTDQDRFLADLSRHYCPATLAESIQPLDSHVQLWISHLKPGQGELIMDELKANGCLAYFKPQALVAGQILSF
jgi:cAMP phosphodiesterase